MWMRSGVKYIQINDAAGNVLVAVATANGTILSLPMGIDAQRLQTSQNSNAAATAGTASNVTVTVYQDSTVTIVAGTSSDGGVMFRADTCTNPVECSTHLSPQ
jgi:ribosomal protein L11